MTGIAQRPAICWGRWLVAFTTDLHVSGDAGPFNVSVLSGSHDNDRVAESRSPRRHARFDDDCPRSVELFSNRSRSRNQRTKNAGDAGHRRLAGSVVSNRQTWSPSSVRHSRPASVRSFRLRKAVALSTAGAGQIFGNFGMCQGRRRFRAAATTWQCGPALHADRHRGCRV